LLLGAAVGAATNTDAGAADDMDECGGGKVGAGSTAEGCYFSRVLFLGNAVSSHIYNVKITHVLLLLLRQWLLLLLLLPSVHCRRPWSRLRPKLRIRRLSTSWVPREHTTRHRLRHHRIGRKTRLRQIRRSAFYVARSVLSKEHWRKEGPWIKIKETNADIQGTLLPDQDNGANGDGEGI